MSASGPAVPTSKNWLLPEGRREPASCGDPGLVTHHLLLLEPDPRKATGTRTRSAVLPPYRHVILRRGHQCEGRRHRPPGRPSHPHRPCFRTLGPAGPGRGEGSWRRSRMWWRGISSAGTPGGPPPLQRLDFKVHPALDRHPGPAWNSFLRSPFEPRRAAGDGEGPTVRLGKPRPGAQGPGTTRRSGSGERGCWWSAWAVWQREVGELRQRIEELGAMIHGAAGRGASWISSRWSAGWRRRRRASVLVLIPEEGGRPLRPLDGGAGSDRSRGREPGFLGRLHPGRSEPSSGRRCSRRWTRPS